MALDFQGNVVSAVQITALILLVIGVYPSKIRTKNSNLIMHGFLSILALALNVATVAYVMAPILFRMINSIRALTILQSAIVWLHIASGVTAITMGTIIVAYWFIHPLGELGCAKTWKLMLPTFLIWAVALILGLTLDILKII